MCSIWAAVSTARIQTRKIEPEFTIEPGRSIKEEKKRKEKKVIILL